MKKWIAIVAIGLIFGGVVYWNNKPQNSILIDNSTNQKPISNEQYIAEINNYVEQIKSTEEKNIKTIEANLTELELGQEATDFMNTLEVNEIPGTVKIYDTKAVTISPYSDFLDIQSYYYKDNKLVLYSREFMGIGGFANYYFRDGKLIDIKTQVEEEMNFTPETAESILQRANDVYQKYIEEVYFSATGI